MNWDDAIRALGGIPQPTDLEARYAEPHRRYHNSIHVRQVVRDAVALTSSWDPGVAGERAGSGYAAGRDCALVALAAWAHDVVYDGRPGDDERASAAWARRHLISAGVGEVDVARVEGLVLATLDHSAPLGDRLAEALLDADLAILGAEPVAYERYRLAVRAEYAHVADDQWRVGRAAVLRSLLVKEPLYRTPAARVRWAGQARRNLRNELAGLGSFG
jgi:predicted metal-dependent HD superfamily phosphohydrolase